MFGEYTFLPCLFTDAALIIFISYQRAPLERPSTAICSLFTVSSYLQQHAGRSRRMLLFYHQDTQMTPPVKALRQIKGLSLVTPTTQRSVPEQTIVQQQPCRYLKTLLNATSITVMRDYPLCIGQASV